MIIRNIRLYKKFIYITIIFVSVPVFVFFLKNSIEDEQKNVKGIENSMLKTLDKEKESQNPIFKETAGKVLAAEEKHPLVASMDYFQRTAEYCEDILTDWSSFELDPSYNKLLPILEDAIRIYEKGDGEGHSGQLKIETNIFHHIARQPSVETICETGFNLGHSSFNWLSANPTAKVYSFDVGLYPFIRPMNETIHKIFPDNRHTLTLGDSTKTLPKAIKDKVLPLCDVALVDGGHSTTVARSDIAHFANHMKDDNLILFDDHPTSWSSSFGKAWDDRLYGPTLKMNAPINYDKIREELGKKKYQASNDDITLLNDRFTIVELLRCKMRSEMNKLPRGVVVGTVIRI